MPNKATQKDKFSLCRYFTKYSIQIWEEIEFTRNQKLELNETTITQNMVMDFWRMAKQALLPIQIFEAPDEAANGNDLEILIETDRGYLLFVVQAKKIKSNNAYLGISHTVRGIQQIDLLIDYAKKRQALPLYMFYNYINDLEMLKYEGSKSTVVLLGCTIANAEIIKANYFSKDGLNKWRIPSFKDVHITNPIAIPFHQIVCDLLENDVANILELPGSALKDLHFYTYKELTTDSYWKNMLSGASIGFIPDRQTEKSHRAVHQNTFSLNPKYRIVLSRRKPATKALYEVE